MTERIPSTVLAGWLGSGKTTLLNELLGKIESEHVAVIVNDVGDINVDAALIKSSSGDRIELTDGCICCSIGSSLALTLRDLLSVNDPPDRLIIEASGIAEPARVAAYGDRRRMEPPSIVVTVDATDVMARSTDVRYGDLLRRQIAQADAIVITKKDLCDDARVGGVARWLADEIPATPIIDRGTALSGRPALGIGPEIGEPGSISRLTIDFANDLVDLPRLGRVLDSATDLIRAKGVLTTFDGLSVLVDYSAGRYTTTPFADQVDPNVRQKLVLIGGTDSTNISELGVRLRKCVGEADR